MSKEFFVRCALSLVVFAVITGSALTVGAAENGKNGDVFVTGKVFCSLKLPVLIPFTGQIVSVRAYSGLSVKEGDSLARYTLDPQAAMVLRRSVQAPQVGRLEAKVARLAQQIRQAESKRRDLKKMVDEKLAANASLQDIQAELNALHKEYETSMAELNAERKLAQDNLKILEKDLGQPVSFNNIPEEVDLIAPMGGHVVWVSESLRPGAKLNRGTTVASVGVMNPMILLAQVHEMEALKLKIGDRAEFTPESIPDRSFACRITRISWAPVDARIDQPSYYQVEFDLPNPDMVLKEGQKGNIRFIAGQ